MPRAVTFGEGLLRLSPPGGRRLEQAHSLEIWPGGSELNVAIGLARLGTDAAWVSRLPRNALGRLVAAHAGAHGVDTDHVLWADGARLGLYFLELAAAPRHSSVLYDRSGSAFAELAPDDLHWPSILDGASAFHVSGITAAVSDRCADAAAQGLAAARAAGCHTSYDVNLRRLLIEPDRARELCEDVSSGVDTVFVSLADAAALFGVDPDGEPAELAGTLRERLGAGTVVLSAAGRFRAAAGDETLLVSRPRHEPVDPIGAGDAFCAGFLHATLRGDAIHAALEVGDAASAVKLTIPGDAPLLDASDLEAVGSPAPTPVRR